MTKSRALALMTLLIPALALGVSLYLKREPSLQLSYASATVGTIAREVLTTGTLEPATEVNAGTQVSGTIQALQVDFNARVKAGQIIAQLDPAVYDTALAQARAGLIQAEADAERARIEADDANVKAGRASELESQALITQAELDTAQLAAKEASAELVAARATARASAAAVEQARINRERTIIRSPIDGVVVSRNVEVGQTLAASLESPVLFRIADLRKMRLLAEISEADVGGVQRGSLVRFEIESLGPQQFSGTVSEVRLQPVMQQAGSVGTSGTSGSASNQPASTGSAANPTTPTPQATSSGGTTRSQTSTSTSTSQTSQSTPAAPAGAIVAYTAIIDVDNTDSRIAPGSTAIVTLPTAQRSDVTRIPNIALGFRPAVDVLEVTGQKSLELPSADAAEDPTKGRQGYVWKYEAGKFVPIAVRLGVSDERWTELLGGAVQPGDNLVTTAARR